MLRGTEGRHFANAKQHALHIEDEGKAVVAKKIKPERVAEEGNCILRFAGEQKCDNTFHEQTPVIAGRTRNSQCEGAGRFAQAGICRGGTERIK